MVYTDPAGALSTGKANYKEFWYAMAGLAGESQNFDGNGTSSARRAAAAPTR